MGRKGEMRGRNRSYSVIFLQLLLVSQGLSLHLWGLIP